MAAPKFIRDPCLFCLSVLSFVVYGLSSPTCKIVAESPIMTSMFQAGRGRVGDKKGGSSSLPSSLKEFLGHSSQ